MKALVYTNPYTFEYTEVPDPTIGEDDVLIRIKACGICGSDVAGHTGKTGRRLPPLIMGHEAAGIVERVGRNVVGFAPGDRICFDSTVTCNQCPACQQGLYNRCVKRQVLGVSVPEFKRDGAFAERLAVPHWICAKIPENMTRRMSLFRTPLRNSTNDPSMNAAIGTSHMTLELLTSKTGETVQRSVPKSRYRPR